MEDKYPVKEIKVMEGVYLWKPIKNSENNDQKNNPAQIPDNKKNNNSLIGKQTSIGDNNYLCNGMDELVKIYEIEFDELGNKILSLFQSNEDMLEFDPHDYDLIQAREENLQLIDKKMEQMIKIQKKMKEICSYHPLVNIDIFDYFGIGKNSKNENKDVKDKEEIEEDKKIENNKIEIETKSEDSNNNQQNQNQNNNYFINEIEL